MKRIPRKGLIQLAPSKAAANLFIFLGTEGGFAVLGAFRCAVEFYTTPALIGIHKGSQKRMERQTFEFKIVKEETVA